MACVPPLPGQEVTQQRSQLLGQIVEAWHLTCLALVTDDGNVRDLRHNPGPGHDQGLLRTVVGP